MTSWSIRRPGVARGMTLLEVLAAIFVIGMGLIMVAGAFPVGADQNRRMVEQTEGATIARSAMEICREKKYVRHLTSAFYYGVSPDNKARPRGGPSEPWRVWNATRWAYLEDFDDSAMWPPRGGDYVWRPFVTRVSNVTEAPLFRLTIVVCRHNDKYWDLYDPASPTYDPDGTASLYIPAGIRKININSYTGNKVVMDGSKVKVGDYLMDPRTGHCYQIIANNGSTVNISPDPVDTLPTSGANYYLFSNVVGIYEMLISE